VHDVEDARRESRLEEQLRDAHRHRGVALAGLEHHGVAGGERGADLPERDHRREVEGGDGGDDAERLPHRVDVDAGAGPRGVLALEQVRGARRELDDLDAALDVTLRIVDGLPVLAREQFGERLHLALDEVEEAQQHPRPLLGIGRGPLLLGGFGVRDRGAHLVGRGERHARLHGTGARVEHVGEASFARSMERTAHEVRDCTSHCATSLRATVGTSRVYFGVR
jgi:hypothetical protein